MPINVKKLSKPQTKPTGGTKKIVIPTITKQVPVVAAGKGVQKSKKTSQRFNRAALYRAVKEKKV